MPGSSRPALEPSIWGRHLDGDVDVLGGIVAGAADALDHAGDQRLVPVDAFGQVGHDGDTVLFEAHRAGVLPGLATQRLNMVGEAQRDGAIDPVLGLLAGFERGGGVFLQQGKMLGGQRGDLADRQHAYAVQGWTVG